MSDGTAPAPRSAVARVARNGVLNASADILGKVASLVYFALVARQLGGDTLGDYVFAMALSSLIWSLTSFGLDRMTLRDVARDPVQMRDLVVPLATMKFTAALTVTGLAGAVLALGGRGGQSVALVLILGLNAAISLAISSAQAVFAANERMEHVFITKVPWAFAQSLVGIAVILAGGGIVLATLASAVAVAIVAGAGVTTLLLRHYGRPSPRLRVREWPGLLRRALPFGAQEMFGQIIFRFDTVLLGLLAASAVVGAYGAAYRMLESTLFVAWSIGYAVMPMYSYLHTEPGDRSLTLLYEGSLKLVLAATAPIALVFGVCSYAIVDLVYGVDQYADAVDVMRILAPTIAVYGIGHLAGLLVLVRRPGRLTILATATVAVFNVTICLVLIPLFGERGAAVATLASEALLAVIVLVLAVRVVGAPRLVWVMGSPLVAAAAMGAAIWPVRDELALALPIGAVVYLAVLAALEARRWRDDLDLLRSIAGRRAEPVPAS
jgi:O-antigen/teichoic acid export membrane protein